MLSVSRLLSRTEKCPELGLLRRFFGMRTFTTPPGPIITLLRATRTSTVFDFDCFRLLIARTLPS
jgi:hypothetical protein